MPMFVVLLLVAFYGIGLWLLVTPVRQIRLTAFLRRYSLDLAEEDQARLHSYLAVRRRARVAGVLVAASIGLLTSIPDNRVQLNFLPMLGGWLAGAIVAEWRQRDGTVPPVSVPRWWAKTFALTSLTAVLGIAAAALLRSDGVGYEPLIGWAVGVIAAVAVVLAAVSRIKRRSLRDADEVLATVTTVDAVRSLIIGGTALSLMCVSSAWTLAVPGPYADVDGVYPVMWFAAVVVAVVIFAIASAQPAVSGGWASHLWLALAVVIMLPMTWAVPMRLAQEAPLTVQEAQPTARVQLVRLDHVPAVQAELGLVPDEQARVDDDPGRIPWEIIGRIDVARPAPEGSRYELLAFDRRTNAPLGIYGIDGRSGWNGIWSQVLPARYPWLSPVLGAKPGGLYSDGPSGVSADPVSGVLAFRMFLSDSDKKISAEDVQVVLMLVGHGAYIYWATPVPNAFTTAST